MLHQNCSIGRAAAFLGNRNKAPIIEALNQAKCSVSFLNILSHAKCKRNVRIPQVLPRLESLIPSPHFFHITHHPCTIYNRYQYNKQRKGRTWIVSHQNRIGWEMKIDMAWKESMG